MSKANVSEMHLKVGNWLALYLVPVILLPEVKTKEGEETEEKKRQKGD
jgi:hypothetical protein